MFLPDKHQSVVEWERVCVCVDGGGERLGKGDSACCWFNLLDFRSDGDWTVTQAIAEKWTKSLPSSHYLNCCVQSTLSACFWRTTREDQRSNYVFVFIVWAPVSGSPIGNIKLLYTVHYSPGKKPAVICWQLVGLQCGAVSLLLWINY